MANPWEKYQQPASLPSQAPWAKYQQPEAVAPRQDYGDVLRSAKVEIDRLNTQQTAAGRETLSAGAQAALTDQYRQESGFAPTQPQMDELNIVDYGSARNTQAEQSGYSDLRQGFARNMAGIGANLAGVVSTDLEQKMRENVEATYGTQAAGALGKIGEVGGATLSVIGAIPAGPLGMAALYGASGFGATRGDIAERRRRGEDISAGEEAIAATLIGAAEGLSGLITGGILNKAKPLVLGTGAGRIGAETARTGILNLIKKEAPDILTEIGEEAAVQFVTNAIRKNTYNEDQVLSEGVLEAGLMAIVPTIGAKGVARRLQGKPQRSALTAQERQPSMLDSRHDYLKTEEQNQALQAEGETLGILKPEGAGPKLGTPERRAIEDAADAQIQAEVEAMEASGEIEPAPVEPDAGRFPASVTIDELSQIEAPSADLEAPTDVDLEMSADFQKGNLETIDHRGEDFVRVNVPVEELQIDRKEIESEAEVEDYRTRSVDTMPPIAVGPPADGRVEGDKTMLVADGKRRATAAKLNGETHIAAYVPAWYAQERGFEANLSREQQLDEARQVVRPPDMPTQEQRAQQEVDSEAAMEQQLQEIEQQDADAAEVEAQAESLARKVKALDKPKQTSSTAEIMEAAQSQRDAEPQTKVGRMVNAVKRGLISRTADPETGALERRIIASRQRQMLSRDDTMRFIGMTKKQAKSEGVDLSDPLVRKNINDAIEGRNAPDHIKSFVETVRKKIDAKSEEMATRLDALGLKDRAALIRENKGKYLQEFANPESWGKMVTKRLFGPPEVKFTKSFGKMKRDAPILEVDGAMKKFKTTEERDVAYDEAVENRGSRRGVRKIEPITEQEREEKFIRSPLYRAGMTMMNMEHDIETMAILQDVAKAYGIKRPKSVKAADTQLWASENGLVPLPQAGRLHALTDIYVPKRIGERFNERYEMPSHARHFYNTYLRIWKDSKTTKNPATHARNMLSNAMFFSTYAGVNPANPANWGVYAKAAKMLKEGTTNPHYRMLVERGVVGSEFTSVELNEELHQHGFDEDPMPAIIRMALKVHRGTQKVYQAEDVIFKLAKFNKEMAEHGDADRAAAEVDYYFPNYNEISRVTKALKSMPIVGVPFAAFMDQSIRITGRTAVREPQRLATAMALPFAIDQISRAYLGVEDEEDKLMKRDGWGYFTKTFTHPLIYNPFAKEGRDKQGAAVSLNMASVIPLLNDIVPQENNGQLQIPWFASDPLGNTFREQMGGRDSFTGRQFIKEDNTARENALARLGQLSDAMLPAPPIATSGKKRIMKATEERSEETLGMALMASLAGVNVQRDYVPESDAKKLWYQLIEDGEIGAMIDSVDAYNENYRQGKTLMYDIDRIFSGYSSTLRASRATAVKQATAELFAGNDKKAQKIVDKYNKGRGIHSAPATLLDAQSAMRADQARGRRY